MPSSNIVAAIAKLRFLLGRKEKLQCVGIVCFALATSLLEVITATIIVVFAQVLNQPETGKKYVSLFKFAAELSSARIIFYMAIVCGVVYLIKNIVAALEVFYQNFTIQKMNYRFKNKLLYNYAVADYEAYSTRNSSIGVAIINSDTELMFSNGIVSLATIISESIVFICLLTMVVIMNPFLAIIIFIVVSISSLIVVKGLFPLFYLCGQRLQQAHLLSNQNLLQFFHAFKEIVLLCKRNFFINNYQLHSFKKATAQAIQTATNHLPRITLEVLFVGLFVIAVSYLCFKHNTPQYIMGILGGYLYVGFRLMPGLNRIISQLNIVKASIPAIERIYNEYTSISVKEHYLDIPEFRFSKNITFRNVSFKYLNNEKEVIKNINLEVKKGECIGIIGETGSGKSTLIDLLLGLLKPSGGDILIDGLYPVNSYQWHRKIGYVSQNFYLVDDTIETNIAFGEVSSQINYDKLNKAIDSAQLRKFINQLEFGVKTIIGERGVRLSGGERQRVAIARALYINPDVLIFDEASSSLDNETETKLFEAIYNVSKDRTVIMVAHRVTTLKSCDRIIIMENGVISKITSYLNIDESRFQQQRV